MSLEYFKLAGASSHGYKQVSIGLGILNYNCAGLFPKSLNAQMVADSHAYRAEAKGFLKSLNRSPRGTSAAVVDSPPSSCPAYILPAISPSRRWYCGSMA
jgi:hypothetical protein